MTVATWCLLVLAAVTALLCVGFAVPAPDPEPHAFVTDPFELADEHVGRHEAPGGETTDLIRYRRVFEAEQRTREHPC